MAEEKEYICCLMHFKVPQKPPLRTLSRVAQPRSQGLFWEESLGRTLRAPEASLFTCRRTIRQVLFNPFASSNVSHKQDNYFAVMQIKL